MKRNESKVLSVIAAAIVALTVWQVALVMLARRRVSAWLARRGPWTAVVAVGSMAMTLYLWHITAMVALYGLVVAVDGITGAEGYQLVKGNELFTLDRELSTFTIPTGGTAAIRPEGLDSALERSQQLVGGGEDRGDRRAHGRGRRRSPTCPP